MTVWTKLLAEDEVGISAKIETAPSALLIKIGEDALKRLVGFDKGKIDVDIGYENKRGALRIRFDEKGEFALPKPVAKNYKLSVKQLQPAEEYKKVACDARIDDEGALILTLPEGFQLKEKSRAANILLGKAA